MSKKNKQIILAATNDLSTDQRVHKVAETLIKSGFSPMLIGRRLKKFKRTKFEKISYQALQTHLIKALSFMPATTFRLFFFLLFKKPAAFVANDLDTLPACYFAYKIKMAFGNKNIKLVYDSHELFTEVPELNGRNFVKKTWLFLEKLILPKVKNSCTVCESIASYYQKQYGIKMQIISNFSLFTDLVLNNQILDIKLPVNKKIILYQGALNIGRGIEHVINILNKIDDAVLVIAGKGDIENDLKKRVNENQLNNKVVFVGAIPLEQLFQLTKMAHVGLVLQEDLSLSYRYVLPNRLFDFMKAEVPILASNLPELHKIVSNEKIGLLIDGFEKEELIDKIKELLFNEGLIAKIKIQLRECKRKYSWEIQEKKLIDFYQNLD
ncbi:MAG: glycosyltransferase family 4 protein [Chloroflexia bacterium]|nr:glycosyltransferase family 4 protein [Chloroflexia bacterium]